MVDAHCLEQIDRSNMNIKDETTLYIILPIFNPRQYKVRYELFNEFLQRMENYRKTNTATFQIYVAEIAFGNRPFHVTEKGNPQHIQLRSNMEMWHKENMINMAVCHLPQKWKYVAWIDADIMFSNEAWIDDTVASLQHYPIVQLFQTACDLGPSGQVIQVHNGFAYMYKTNHLLSFEQEENKQTMRNKYSFWHPGYAWACTKKAWNQLGGLLDWAIMGAADHHMASAFIGKVLDTVHKGVHPNYIENLKRFETLCDEYIHGNIGYINGNINHFWHGKKKDRRYQERWLILVKYQFDPLVDLKKEWNGLLALDTFSARQKEMAREVADYFNQRNEDSIDE